MSRNWAEIGVGMAGLLLAGFVFSQIGTIQTRSFGDPIGARMMPQILGVALALVSLGIIVSGARIKEDNEAADDSPVIVVMIVASALYVGLMPYLGFYVVTWLLAFLVQFLGKVSRTNILRPAIGATLICVAFYLVFDLGLKVSFLRLEIFGLG